MVTPADVRDIAPEFALETDERLQRFIDRALVLVPNAAFFGPQYDLAMTYLAAHLLTMAARGLAGASGSGPVSSMSEGSLSISYASGGGDIDFGSYGGSGYGMQFFMIRRGRPVTPIMADTFPCGCI